VLVGGLLKNYAPPRNASDGRPRHRDYDTRAKAISQFVKVALGDVTNTLRGVRPGAHSLGDRLRAISNLASDRVRRRC
jgi:hypothetical protein